MDKMIRITEGPLKYTIAGIAYPVHVEAGRYADNDRIALELVFAETIQGTGNDCIEGERVTTATVNLSDDALAPNCVYVKDWTENEGMAASRASSNPSRSARP